MNLSLLKYHYPLLIILITVISLIFIVTFQAGQFKAIDQLDFFDIAGEGGITLMTLVWIFFILISRPAGKVTNLLFAGLTLTYISMQLDVIDEFIFYAESNTWITTIESLPAPIGMIIMSFALYLWHQEQLIINAQLRNTEKYYRDHSLTDYITGLYSAKYMKNQLRREIIAANTHQQSFSMMLIDIRQFDLFNRTYGDKQGDLLLRETAQVILMNLRDNDLACRYASDRFIVLMPATALKTAEKVAFHIEQSIANLGFKVGSSSTAKYQNVSCCTMECQGNDDYLVTLDKLNEHMQTIKSNKDSKHNTFDKISA